MKFLPNSVVRLSSRSILKLNAASPTIFVVSGVVGLGATAILASKASRRLDPVLDKYKKARAEIGYVSTVDGQKLNKTLTRIHQKALLRLYIDTAADFTKLYGPTLFVGTCSAVAVLGGHKMLVGRHVATMAAYSGLLEEFRSYRGRVVQTLGEDVERAIFDGAHGEYEEDPDHKGEYKLMPKFDPDESEGSYLRPWFDEVNANWTRDPISSYSFLKGVQQHMNNLLQIRGHVFLNDVYDALCIPRRREGAIAGWVWDSARGDNYVDFGIMTSIDPHTIAFRNGLEKTVRLNFNIDGTIWNLI